MPRKPKTAPNAQVKLSGAKDQRMATELMYDAKNPARKHFWKEKTGASLAALVKAGLVDVVKDINDEEVTNGISVLCSMSREEWELRQAGPAEASYEEVKAIRSSFQDMHVPLRQFADPKTPE